MSDEPVRRDDVSSTNADAEQRTPRPTPGNGQTYDLEPPSEPIPPAQSSSASESRPELPSPAPPLSHPATDLPTPFVEGFGGIRFTATLLAVLIVAMLVVVGVRAGSLGFQQVLVHLASAVLQVAAYGSLGALASIAAARCVGTRVAEPELFALRMLAATAAYQLLFATGTPIPTRIDDRILGMAGYATTVWLLFKLSPRETGLVALWHFGLASLLWLSMAVSSLVVEPKPPPSDPGTRDVGLPPNPPGAAP